MIKDDEAVVETDVAVGQFQIADGSAREFRLGEVFQVVAPETEAAAERKRQVNFVENFKSRHERIEQMPGAAELQLMVDGWWLMAGRNFAARAEGSERQKRICCGT